MKKIYIFLSLCLILIAGCGSTNDFLSGKTFDLAYTPSPDSEQNAEENHQTFMTLKFDDRTVTREDGNEITGEYALIDNKLVINFIDEEEELKVEFTELNESEKEFSSYSTEVSNTEFVEQNENIRSLMDTGAKFSADLPIEFIEK